MDAQKKTTAVLAYQMYRSGVPNVMKEVERMAKAGEIEPASKKWVESSKGNKIKEFVAKLKIQVVERAERVGGTRGGVLETVKSLVNGDENHRLFVLAKNLKHHETLFVEELKKHKRTFSPGYVRGKEDEAADTTPSAV